MALRADRRGTGDIMETLLSLMVVCAGLLLLTAALPALLAPSEPPSDRSREVTSLLVKNGILDLHQAEQDVSSLPEGTEVRVVRYDGTTLELLDRPRPTVGDRFVTRTAVLVRTPSTGYPAILEVACAG
jgi:hypothetical protein